MPRKPKVPHDILLECLQREARNIFDENGDLATPKSPIWKEISKADEIKGVLTPMYLWLYVYDNRQNCQNKICQASKLTGKSY